MLKASKHLLATALLPAFLLSIGAEALAQASLASASAKQRPLPEGVTLVAELDAKPGPLSLYRGSRQDQVDVVEGRPSSLDGFIDNAFGYGNSENPLERCLLISSRQSAASNRGTWRQWMLCGKSSILVLQSGT